MKIKKVIVITALIAALGASISLAFLQQKTQGPISEERAIAIIKAHVVEADDDPHENIQIDEIELRPPTKFESDYLREWGEEQPKLVWFARITRFPNWLSPPENVKWAGYGGIIYLDAYTGEVVFGSFLD